MSSASLGGPGRGRAGFAVGSMIGAAFGSGSASGGSASAAALAGTLTIAGAVHERTPNIAGPTGVAGFELPVPDLLSKYLGNNGLRTSRPEVVASARRRQP